MNISIDIDKIGGKLTTDKKGNEIIILPVKKSYIDTFPRYDGTNGIRLNFTSAKLKEKRVSENGLFEEKEIIKQNIKKEVYEKLTEEQKKKIQICGQISEYIGKSEAIPEPPEEEIELVEENDLPF